jgi:uncharacterized protein with PIN domain
MSVKFLIDFMLGKLTRELRVLGIDALYIEKKDLATNPLSALKSAKQAGRTFLTRNTRLKAYPDVLFVSSEKIEEQVSQIIKHFNLQKKIKPFTRCLRCNQKLIEVIKDDIKGKVPFYIFQTKDKFVYCPKCEKYYWEGTHLKNMKRRVKKIS